MPNIAVLKNNDSVDLYPVVHRKFVYDDNTGISLEEENFSIIVDIPESNWNLYNTANISYSIDPKYLKDIESSAGYPLNLYEPIVTVLTSDISTYKNEVTFFNTINSLNISRISDTIIDLSFHSVNIENRINLKLNIYFKKTNILKIG